MTQAIYLDYAATTPLDPRIVDKMSQCLTMEGAFGNPASPHCFGVAAKQWVEAARTQVAEVLHAEPSEIIFTSGATESNNLALKGTAALYQEKGKHIVTVKTEHPSVLDTCQFLEKQGFYVTYLTPLANGLLDLEAFRSSLRDDTILASVMHVNNEIGVIQDVAAIANITRDRGILFHVDAAQSGGKLPINMQEMPVDLMSFSAHKVYGPKGVGSLYVRRKPRVRVAGQLHGGGQEQGMRSGTLPTAQIVGMGEAFALAASGMQAEKKRLEGLRKRLIEGLQSFCHIKINGDLSHCYPGIFNCCIGDWKARELLLALPDLAISVGSACVFKGAGSSYVLRALGLSEEEAVGGLRFSLGRFTTDDEVDQALAQIKQVVR